MALTGALAGNPAAAQDNDGLFWADRLNQITVSATRTPVRLEDVPATISVKTDERIADDIQDGKTTTAKALTEARALFAAKVRKL